jgi:hypothetical protein
MFGFSLRYLQALSMTRDAGNALAKDSGVKEPNQPLLNKSINSLLDKVNTLQADRLKIKPHWAKTQEELEQEEKSPR